jgi:acetylornithine deacetylase/succinyl-diaminopimelate desuccinylase family protein
MNETTNETRDEMKNNLLEYIELHKRRMIQFLEQLVRTNSENPPGNEKKAVEIIERHMLELGLQGMEKTGLHSDRPNLLYLLKGTHPNGYKTIFNAHLDTKPPGDISLWKSHPFSPEFRNDRIYGLGTTDMKGALVAMIYAFAAVNQLGMQTPGSLELILSADEEAGSKYGAKFLADQNKLDADYVIIGEPSGIREDWESICVVSRGVCCFKVKVYGEQMHSSLTDKLNAVNANVKMAQVLSRFKERLHLNYPTHHYCPEGPTVNPGVVVKGGVYYGVNPGYSEFYCDIRTIPGMTLKQVTADLEACLQSMAAEDPELRLELEMAEPPLNWIGPTEIGGDTPSVKAIQDACRTVLGTTPPLRAFTGGTDAAFFQGVAGIPTVPSFGPGLLTEAHSPNESLSLRSFVEAAKMYALIAWDMANRTK